MGHFVVDWMINWILFLKSLMKKNFHVTTSQGKLVIIFSYFHIFVWLIIFNIDSFDKEQPISLGQAIQDSWTKRKSWLKHKYAVTGWALSVLTEILSNFASVLTGEHHLMMERVVERQVPPCPNDQVSRLDMTNIIDFFWQEFKTWQNMTGSYAVFHGQFSIADALEGRTHIWHETWNILITVHKGPWICYLQGHIKEIGNSVRRACMEQCETNQRWWEVQP